VIPANHDTFVKMVTSEKFSFVKRLGFDSASTSYNSYTALAKQLKESGIQLFPLENPVIKMREVKEEHEIALLREAAALGSQGYDTVCSLLKEGITEKEVATELEIFWKRKGGEGIAFEPIIAFGKNSSMPHYHPGDTQLKKGDNVLIDIGVTLNHYQSDMTRVVFFGDPNPKLLEINAIVTKAQALALELCRPGTTIGELDDAARNHIKAHGYGEQFPHSLGHGIGLAVHESPILRNRHPYQDQILKAGMVITIEPAIYLPGIGGIRLEDSIAITDTGYENLTKRP